MDEQNENEKEKEITVKKELRTTAFEYSSSDSDEENDKISRIKKKISFPIFSNKKFKSSNNLVVGEKKPKIKKKQKIYLSRYVRMLLFFLLLINSVVIDLDAGVIVSSYKSFTHDLNMSDFQFGSLNSITTVGKIISLIFYMVIINKNHRKFFIVTSAFLNGVSFFAYFLNKNFYYIATVKFLTSFCKVFINVYMPVWVDQFGIKKYKTLLLTLVYMVTSYGRIVGAWIGTVIFNNEWKKAFSCCGIIIISLSACLFMVPQKYYSTKYMIVEQKKTITGNVVEKIVPTKDENTDATDIEIKRDIEKMKDIKFINEEKKTKSSLSSKETEKLDKDEEKEKDNDADKDDEIEEKETNDKKEKLIYDYNTNNNNENDEKNMYKNLSYLGKLKIVILNKCFIFSSLSRASLFFIIKIIHVFLKKYTFEALKYTNEIKFFYYYSLTTILAPSIGSLLGGAICNKFLGGYESRRSIWLIIFFGALAVIFVTLARITNDFNYLIIYIFGYFFSVSAFLPTISGYIISSLHKELKGFGSSFDSLITNVCGKLPSPIFYGIINDIHKKDDQKYAWNKSLIVYYVGTIFIYLACFFKWKTSSKMPKLTNNIVKKTMKDVYTFHRSSLVRAEKPKPKYADGKKFQKPVELEDVEEESSTMLINKSEKKNKENKKKLLEQLQKKENGLKNSNSN